MEDVVVQVHALLRKRGIEFITLERKTLAYSPVREHTLAIYQRLLRLSLYKVDIKIIVFM